MAVRIPSESAGDAWPCYGTHGLAPAALSLDADAAGAEMAQVRQDFRRLISRASAADLRRRTDGTKWTNQQLLFHMLFGYLIVCALLPLARLFGRLPARPAQHSRGS